LHFACELCPPASFHHCLCPLSLLSFCSDGVLANFSSLPVCELFLLLGLRGVLQTSTDFKQGNICIMCACVIALGKQLPSASVYERGSLGKISVQIRQPSKELVVGEGLNQRPQGRSNTTCTTPPPPKSVLVDFKNACAQNSSATTKHNMRSPRHPIFCATVRIFAGSAATSSPEKPHLTP
jgi:hypothetical protein